MARPRKIENDEVLFRAVDLLWRDGCDGVSTRDLETALGLKAPAIYRRFGSKNNLLVESVNYYVDKIVQRRIERLFQSSDDPVHALHRFFREMFKPHKNEARLRGCFLNTSAGQVACSDPLIRNALNRGMEQIREAFRKQIEQAIGLNLLDRHSDPKALANILFLNLQGVLAVVRGRKESADLETGIDDFFQMFLRAYGTVAGRKNIPGQA